jgi:pilus assembly protein CpaE
MYPLTAGSVVENKEIRAALAAALAEMPLRMVFELAELPEDWPAFLDRVNRVRPDVILLDITHLHMPLEAIIRDLHSGPAKPSIFALHTSADAEAILSALRAGASEYLFPPFAAPLQAALVRLAQARQQARESEVQGGRTLGFLSAKGGCGATTLACHTAVEIARLSNQSVLLGDFDFQSGLIGFLSKSKSTYTVADAAKNIQRLDASYWRALVSNGVPNLEVIAAPTTPAAKDVPPGSVKQVVAFARTQYNWSVLDLGRNLTTSTLSMLDLMDETYLITTHEVPALHQAKLTILYLLESGYPRERLRLVLNRAPKRMDVTLDEMGEMLGLPVFASIDDDYHALQEAYAEGKLLEGSHALNRSIAAFVERATGLSPASKRKRFSLFG